MKRYLLVAVGRLPFCSNNCVVNALEKHPGAKYVRVSETAAFVTPCYGCGLYLDEAQKSHPNQKD
jgi:hypothetical protein